MLTEDQINFLNRTCPNIWTCWIDIISVIGNVNIQRMNLTEIPVQFGHIEGGFYCHFNKLTTLQGAPSIIEGHFNCDSNLLTTLEGGPVQVGDPQKEAGSYSCEFNLLINLICAPEICNDNFYCRNNQLTSLEGCPKVIKKNLDCKNNPDLHILYGIGKVYETIYYDNQNDLNEWIIQQARKDIYVTYEDISRWIKDNNKFEYILKAQKEIRQYFSPRILHMADSGVYNESIILDYKNFSRLC